MRFSKKCKGGSIREREDLRSPEEYKDDLEKAKSVIEGDPLQHDPQILSRLQDPIGVFPVPSITSTPTHPIPKKPKTGGKANRKSRKKSTRKTRATRGKSVKKRRRRRRTRAKK